jgi:hypothetical protein
MKIQIEKTTKKSKTAKKTAPVPCYTRDDIESILVTVMLCATAIACVLLTLTLFISVLKN